ncbi:MAG: 3-oxoacyl-ACP reductase [Moraxellaceae bacterium]|nr:MAG: 3-oxoacyl-ACP reductase [Moraxellaceae bacterium]
MKDLFSIEGKVALVTGGGRGIGLMIAQGFVEAGAKVYIASRKKEVCEEVAATLSEHGTCIGIGADLSTEAGIKALAEELKSREEKLDILVNNSGVTWGAPLESFPDSAWDKVLGLNLKAPFNLTRELLPLLTKAASPEDPARIINIGSIAADSTTPMAYSYGASKAAIHHLTKVFANQFAAQNITVNAIAPGPFPSQMMAFALDNEHMKKAIIDQVPLKRVGTAEDIAGLSIYLASRAGSYMTGNIIPLDGGSLITP